MVSMCFFFLGGSGGWVVRILRNIVVEGLHLGPLTLGNYQLSYSRTLLFREGL